MKVKSLSHVWLFATPWTAVYQAPLSMGFSRKEYWSGMPLPSLNRACKGEANGPEVRVFCSGGHGSPAHLHSSRALKTSSISLFLILSCTLMWGQWVRGFLSLAADSIEYLSMELGSWKAQLSVSWSEAWNTRTHGWHLKTGQSW